MAVAEEVYLSCENDDTNRGIISSIIESTNKLLNRVRSKSIPPLWPINTNLQTPQQLQN